MLNNPSNDDVTQIPTDIIITLNKPAPFTGRIFHASKANKNDIPEVIK